MSHLIERLRCFEHPHDEGKALMWEAADRIEQLERIEAAAKNLVSVKGRYHTEQAYKQLEEALR